MKKTIIFFTGFLAICIQEKAQTVTDIDGNVYKTVIIGSQTWMAENLAITKLSDGTEIPNIKDSIAWGNLTSSAYCWYDNDSAKYKHIYGALYNWYTVNTNKLCPTGWHVPSIAEWETLKNFLGGSGVAGGKMKEVDTIHWASPNKGATNSSGFSGLPAGDRQDNGTFKYLGYYGDFWSAENILNVESYSLYTVDSVLHRNIFPLTIGISVRCVKDSLTSQTNDLRLIDFIKIYPNPVCKDISIDCSSLNYNEYLIEFINMFGQVVFKKSVIDKEIITINIDNFKPGIYLVRAIVDKKKFYTQKIIIE